MTFSKRIVTLSILPIIQAYIALPLVLVVIPSAGQTDVLNKMKEFSSLELRTRPRESLYLHLDRKIFMAGEVLWFKVYSLNQSGVDFHRMSDRVIVDLVNRKGMRLTSVNVRLENGLGSGFLKLPDTLATNNYCVLAYTNYMLRTDSSYYVDKVSIYNMNDQNVESSNSLGKATIQETLTFYPEGGSLVEGIESTVGVVGKKGAGTWADYEARIVDSQGRTITKFKGSHSGLSQFTLEPKSGQTYSVVVHGIDSVFQLPSPVAKGYILQVTHAAKAILLSLKTNYYQPNNDVLVVVHSAGEVLYHFKLDIASGQINGAIPLRYFREGVNTISVFDSVGQLLSERSILIPGKAPKIDIQFEKEAFEKRSKVNVSIKVTDSEGNPVQAALSLSATDESQAPSDPDKETIASYYWINKALKPGYSYRLDSPGFNKDVGEMMLTSNRKKFSWERLESPIAVLPEVGFTLTGRLMEEFKDKPVSLGRVSYMSADSLPFYGITETNLGGRFMIDSIQAFGSATIFLQGEYKKKMNFGTIQIDSAARLNIFPERTFMMTSISLDSLQRALIQKGSSRRYADLSFDTREDITLLDAVVISGKKEDFIRKGAPPVDGNTLVIDPKDVRGASHPAELLKGVPSVKVSVSPNGSYRITRRGKPLRIFWDGFWFPDPSIIGAYSASQVGRIEIIGSAVYMWSKALGGGGPTDKNESAKYVLRGYQNFRQFNAPSYAAPLPIHAKPDYRATLHWEPNLTTDGTGRAYVEFYTSDLETQVMIQVEGITVDGIPLVGKKGFMIQPRQ